MQWHAESLPTRVHFKDPRMRVIVNKFCSADLLQKTHTIVENFKTLSKSSYYTCNEKQKLGLTSFFKNKGRGDVSVKCQNPNAPEND